jgi:acetolactate synthase-1/2/3 large subunit
MERSGGRLLVDCLAAQGAERAFLVPGESYLDVIDALHDGALAVTVARQEGGASMMAEAWGKMTGRPGICMVTRGPGATNAAAGVHIARQDSTPMLLLVGQIGRDMRGRDAFQEVDYRAFFGPLAKWADEIDHVARIPEMISRAYHVAMSGRPGPVVLALPQDMLVERTAALPAPRVEVTSPVPAPADLARLAGALRGAERPLVIAGGSRWDGAAASRLAEVAARWQLPVAVTFRRQELLPALHPSYAGELTLGPNPDLLGLVREADLILLLGDRFSEIPSQGYELLAIPAPAQRLVHVHPGTDEIGRVYAPWLGLAVPPGAALDAIATLNAPDRPGWAQRTEAAHASWLAWSTPKGTDLMSRLMTVLNPMLGPDAILTNGAGNYSIWMQRFRRWTGHGCHLGPTSGSMGYGLPAAIAAKLRHPERPVVCFAGDGCLQMTIQELATAAEARLALTVIVVDNGLYGTIRAHQARDYPGRVTATAIRNPDFAALARAYGFAAWTVREEGEIAPALRGALGVGGPALVHVLTDPDQLTPDRRARD